MLRHPVVISSLEEDFKRIGLLSENDAATTVGTKDLPKQAPGEAGSGAQGHKPMPSKTGPGPEGGYTPSAASNGGSWLKYRVGEARPEKQSPERKDPNHDYADEDGEAGQIDMESDENSEDSIEEAANIQAFAEAVKFAEEFDRDFDSIDENSEECFVLNKTEMRELEDCGESVTLGFDVLAEDKDDDEDDDSDDDEDDDEDDDKDEAKKPFKSVYARGKSEAKKSKADDDDCDDDDDSDDDDPDADDDDMDEGRRRIAGTNKVMRTHKASSHDKMLAKKYYRSNRSKIAKRRVRIAKSSHGKKLARFGESVAQHLDAIQAFVDSTETFDASEMEESKKAFANIALIADSLREEFEGLHENHPDNEFDKLAFNLDEMAAQAEAIAARLDEGASPDADSLAEAFEAMAENLTSALDTFADIEEGIEEDPPNDDSPGDRTPAEDDEEDESKGSKKKAKKESDDSDAKKPVDEKFGKGGFPFKKGQTGKGKTPAGKD